MAKTDDLFRLVKSLSKAEKRNFLRMCELNAKGKRYMKLYRLMDKQNRYNGVALQRAIYGQRAPGKFSHLRSYLQNLILRSLAFNFKAYNRQMEPEVVLQVKVLMERGMYSLAHKVLRREKKQAEKYEHFDVWIALDKMEPKFFSWVQGLTVEGPTMHMALDVQKKVENQLENLTKLESIAKASQSFLKIKNNYEQTLELNDDYKKIQAAWIDLKKSPPISIRGQEQFLITEYNFKAIENNIPGALKTMQSLLRLYEGNGWLLEGNCSWETEFRKILAYLYFLNQDEDRALAILDELGKSPNETEWQRFLHFDRYLITMLIICIAKGWIARGRQIAGKITHDLPQFESQIPNYRKHAIYCYLTGFALLNDDLETARHWSAKQLALPRPRNRWVHMDAAKLYELMIYFDLNETDLWESSHQSAYRYFARPGRIVGFPKIMLSGFSRLFRSLPGEKRADAMRQFLAKMEEFYRQAKKDTPLASIFPFKAWLKSKLTNKSISESIEI